MTITYGLIVFSVVGCCYVIFKLVRELHAGKVEIKSSKEILAEDLDSDEPIQTDRKLLQPVLSQPDSDRRLTLNGVPLGMNAQPSPRIGDMKPESPVGNVLQNIETETIGGLGHPLNEGPEIELTEKLRPKAKHSKEQSQSNGPLAPSIFENTNGQHNNPYNEVEFPKIQHLSNLEINQSNISNINEKESPQKSKGSSNVIFDPAEIIDDQHMIDSRYNDPVVDPKLVEGLGIYSSSTVQPKSMTPSQGIIAFKNNNEFRETMVEPMKFNYKHREEI